MKTMSLLLSLCLIFQQTGFAQVSGEIDVSSYFSVRGNSIVKDNFRPLHLRYLSYDPQFNNFRLLVDKGDLKEPKETELEKATQILLDHFFIGISLPNSVFWVNLRPDGKNNIIDKELATTDIGKIVLEADVQLKKDTALATSPETPEGRKYWDKLYKKVEELFGTTQVTIPTLVRPWIVPNDIVIRETENNAYIYKATLKVLLEEDYLKGSDSYNFKDPRLKVLNEYSSQLIRELIIPKLNTEINISQRYAALRQVYYSLILAQWFKVRFAGRRGFYSSLIDKKNLNGLTSKQPWSETTYFEEYRKSFKEGEYNLKEPVYTVHGQLVRTYISGGMDLTIKFPATFSQPGERIRGDNVIKIGGDDYLEPLGGKDIVGLSANNPNSDPQDPYKDFTFKVIDDSQRRASSALKNKARTKSRVQKQIESKVVPTGGAEELSPRKNKWYNKWLIAPARKTFIIGSALGLIFAGTIGHRAEAEKQRKRELSWMDTMKPQERQPFLPEDIKTEDMQQGRYQEAIKNFSDLLNLAVERGDIGSQITAYIGLGSAYTGLKNYAGAKSNFDRALKLAQDNNNKQGEISARFGLASYDWEKQDYAQAIEQYKTALVVISNYRGEINRDTTMPEQEKARLVEALSENERVAMSNLAAAYTNLGQSLLRGDNPQIAKYKEALNQNPNDISAYLGLGQIYLQQKDFKEAEANFNVVLKRDDRNLEAYAGLAQAAFEQAQYDIAIENCNKALAINSDSAELHVNLGHSYLYKGDSSEGKQKIENYNSALEAYKKAINLKPEYKNNLQNIITELEKYLEGNEKQEKESAPKNKSSLPRSTQPVGLALARTGEKIEMLALSPAPSKVETVNLQGVSRLKIEALQGNRTAVTDLVAMVGEEETSLEALNALAELKQMNQYSRVIPTELKQAYGIEDVFKVGDEVVVIEGVEEMSQESEIAVANLVQGDISQSAEVGIEQLEQSASMGAIGFLQTLKEIKDPDKQLRGLMEDLGSKDKYLQSRAQKVFGLLLRRGGYGPPVRGSYRKVDVLFPKIGESEYNYLTNGQIDNGLKVDKVKKDFLQSLQKLSKDRNKFIELITKAEKLGISEGLNRLIWEGDKANQRKEYQQARDRFQEVVREVDKFLVNIPKQEQEFRGVLEGMKEMVQKKMVEAGHNHIVTLYNEGIEAGKYIGTYKLAKEKFEDVVKEIDALLLIQLIASEMRGNLRQLKKNAESNIQISEKRLEEAIREGERAIERMSQEAIAATNKGDYQTALKQYHEWIGLTEVYLLFNAPQKVKASLEKVSAQTDELLKNPAVPKGLKDEIKKVKEKAEIYIKINQVVSLMEEFKDAFAKGEYEAAMGKYKEVVKQLGSLLSAPGILDYTKKRLQEMKDSAEKQIKSIEVYPPYKVGRSNLSKASLFVDDASSSIVESNTVGIQEDKKLGGVDFRSLPFVTSPSNIHRPLSSSALQNLSVNLLDMNLEKEWSQIQRMVDELEIIPSSQRIKEYLQVSCYKDSIYEEIDKVMSCLADILRIEEEHLLLTEPALTDFLALLESDKSSQELQIALSQIVIPAK